MYACVSSGLWTPYAPRGVASFSRGDRVMAALQALDVIAIPICRHVSFRLCIIKGRENPEKAARSRSAKFSCSCVHHELSCSSLLIEPTVTGDR
jgi:hypothetical protein